MNRQRLALFAVSLLAVPVASAAPLSPTWTRGSGTTTYEAWDIVTSAAGPNAPNTPTGGAIVDAAPYNPNGTANAFDTSGQSCVTGGGNIYSFAAPTHIDVVVHEYGLGDGYATTVLFQTRTQGTEPFYTGDGGYRLTYTDATGSHTILPVDAAELDRQALGEFGGDLVDYAAVFDLPGSPTSFTISLDASDSSMSFDRASVDTIVTRASAASPLVDGMSPAIGFVPAAVPEPAVLGVGAVAAIGLLGRRQRRAL